MDFTVELLSSSRFLGLYYTTLSPTAVGKETAWCFVLLLAPVARGQTFREMRRSGHQYYITLT